MTNAQIAQTFKQIADILEIQNANRFRVRAYNNASLAIAQNADEMATIYKRGGVKELQKIPGIGADLAAKIEEMLKTNKCKFLQDLKKEVPEGLLAIMQIEGMGPKKTRYVWKKFNAVTLGYLEKLCKSGLLAREKGWGTKSVQNILRSIQLAKQFSERLPIGEIVHTANSILNALKKTKLAQDVEIAGSFRRQKDTVGDLDFLATSKRPKKLIEIFASLPQVQKVEAKGQTKCTVFLDIGIDADLRVMKHDEFGAGLYYFTGSKEHNVAVRQRAQKMGLTINEYGVFKGTPDKKGRRLASRTEEGIFKVLKLPYIPPELRENNGELEGKNPLFTELIELKDIKGDLHMHTNFSDGMDTAYNMILAAKELGRKYIAISDHASPLGMVRGLKPNNFAKYMAMIKSAAQRVKGIEVLVGSEVDIMEDGSLYLPDQILRKLDWVIASVHSGFKQEKNKMTQRIVRAMQNPYVHAIGHPTGRLILRREPYNFDFNEVLKASQRTGTVLEINASWQRLDLNDVHCRAVYEARTMVVIDSDAHHTREFDLALGVGQARRGWVIKEQVLNTRNFKDFKKWLN